MLNQLDLNLLKVLTVFGNTKSVLSAAQSLKVTPSAVSQALKRLESDTGLQLFIRSHKKLTLTFEGKKLLDSSAPLFQTIENTMDELRKRKHGVSGVVRIGAPTEFGANFLISAFAEFAELHPAVSLKLKLGSPRTLLKALLDSELDLAFCDDGPYFSAYRSTLLTSAAFSEELILACSRNFFDQNLASRAGFNVLTSLRHLDYVEDHSAVNIWYQHHFRKKPEQLELALVSENVHALIRGIKNGLGLGMIPSYLVAHELNKGSLVQIRTERQELRNDILLVQHQNRIPTFAEKSLLAHLRKSGTKFRAC